MASIGEPVFLANEAPNSVRLRVEFVGKRFEVGLSIRANHRVRLPGMRVVSEANDADPQGL